MGGEGKYEEGVANFMWACPGHTHTAYSIVINRAIGRVERLAKPHPKPRPLIFLSGREEKGNTMHSQPIE